MALGIEGIPGVRQYGSSLNIQGGTVPSFRLSYMESNMNWTLLVPMQDPADMRKCAKLFGKCLEFMDEQEHLVRYLALL
jgi:hypothetical protein